jgi:hypothetical protein
MERCVGLLQCRWEQSAELLQEVASAALPLTHHWERNQAPVTHSGRLGQWCQSHSGSIILLALEGEAVISRWAKLASTLPVAGWYGSRTASEAQIDWSSLELFHICE